MGLFLEVLGVFNAQALRLKSTIGDREVTRCDVSHYRHPVFPQRSLQHFRNEEKQMRNLSRVSTFVLLLSPLALTLATGSYAQDQYPILDKVAAKVVQKYTSTPCEQLWQKKQGPPQPPSAQEQKAIQFLKTDPQMRAVFINKVAPPIANKMFECGLIP
jgi:hypothetical protein